MYLCGLQTCLQLPVSRNVRGKGLWLPPPLKNLCAVHLTKTNIKLQFIILLNNFYMQKYQKTIFDSNSFRKTRTLMIFSKFVVCVWSEAFCCIRWFMNTVCLCTSTPRTEKCGWWKKNKSQLCPKLEKKPNLFPQQWSFKTLPSQIIHISCWQKCQHTSIFFYFIQFIVRCVNIALISVVIHCTLNVKIEANEPEVFIFSYSTCIQAQ